MWLALLIVAVLLLPLIIRFFFPTDPPDLIDEEELLRLEREMIMTSRAARGLEIQSDADDRVS